MGLGPPGFCCCLRPHNLIYIYIYYKNFTIIGRVGSPFIVIFTRAARCPAHNNERGPFQKKKKTPLMIWYGDFLTAVNKYTEREAECPFLSRDVVNFLR
jgi:hypothetical protein